MKMNAIHFNNCAIRGEQRRFLGIETMGIFYKFLLENITDESTWPVILCYYTGLRIHELAGLRIYHLIALLKDDQELQLKRKNDTIWIPMYSDNLKEFIIFLSAEISKQYDVDIQTVSEINNYKIYNSIVFTASISCLQRRIKELFIKCFYKNPPYGFGFHSIRYYLASVLKDDPTTAKIILGHRNLKTTNIYTKVDTNEMREKINTMNESSELFKYTMDKIEM